MATIEYWIQLENRPWDASPHNIDRITGQDMKETTKKDPVEVDLKLPGGAPGPKRTMYNPLRDNEGEVKDALILRRYKPPTQVIPSDAWTVPDDRKVNPWDLNEPDPTDNGTMGTIPGPVIECNVGDSVIVHFRNLDRRPIEFAKRVHSLHPHGFVFAAASDGAYPLSPPASGQPVTGFLDDESFVWSKVLGNVTFGTLKKGDRVPPGGTFIYTWNTVGWPSTAGVWLYHDHSICDVHNVELGAIGIIVIHNPADTEQEVDIRDPNDPTKLDPVFLPDGSPNGSPVNLTCFPFPGDLHIRTHDLEGLGLLHADVPGHGHTGGPNPSPSTSSGQGEGKEPPEENAAGRKPVLEHMIKRGDLVFELDDKLEVITQICLRSYDTPPSKALYLQLFHTLDGVSGMIINGRTFMGNTPTMVAGRDTRMRFGVVGMGSDFHTLHLHGHRWIVPGPQGNTPGAIQSSPQVQAVSQFEDTKIFGPANSFVFTIDGKSGSFMRAGGPDPDDSVGEWHMHCHVLNHMMMGMMGSLLIVKGGEFASTLPRGVPCPMEEVEPQPGVTTIVVTNNIFTSNNVTVALGSQVEFDFKAANHTVKTVSANMADPITINNGGGDFDAIPMGQKKTVTITGMSGGEINYECGIHGASMAGKINIV